MKLKELPRSLLMAMRLNNKTMQELNAALETLPIVVSLTSIPARLNAVSLTIRSLLVQTTKPQKIILWLHQSLEGMLPRALTKLQNDIFEIRFVDLTCPHRKLIHSLELFPDSVIVTCDDDLMYAPDWLARLYSDHHHYPEAIIAHECRKITFTETGAPASYQQWPTVSDNGVTNEWLMSIGYGGVLYPPHSLHPDVSNRELFLMLTPRADDIWFKAMSLLAGTPVRRSTNPGQKPIPIWGTQGSSLKKTNIAQDENTRQWLAVWQHYNLQRDEQE